MPSVANDETVAVLIEAVVVGNQKLVHLGLDRGLQHSLGSVADDLIERTSFVELVSKREYLGVGLSDWTVSLNFRTLAHGVLLVPALGR